MYWCSHELSRPARAEEFLLEDLANYAYMSFGNVSVPQVDDADMFKQTNEAFRIMGITPEEVTGAHALALAHKLIRYTPQHCTQSTSTLYTSRIRVLSRVAVLRVVSSVLLFGNVKITQDKNSDQAMLADNTGAPAFTARSTHFPFTATHFRFACTSASN